MAGLDPAIHVFGDRHRDDFAIGFLMAMNVEAEF
jgi:hypothetical protein